MATEVGLNTKYTHAWHMYLCSLHNVISDFEYRFADYAQPGTYNEENWAFDFGIHPPPNPPTRSPHEAFGTQGGDSYTTISNWFLKLPIARYNYIQNVPSYIAPYCTGIFNQWEAAVGNQQAEWEYLRSQDEYNGPDRPDSIPYVPAEGWGGYSESPAYAAGGIMFTRGPSCAYPPWNQQNPETYEGIPASENLPTEHVITYNHRMKASSPLYIGRTYTGYLKYYSQYWTWRKYDSWDNRFGTPIMCYDWESVEEQEGYDSGYRDGYWLEGVADVYCPAEYGQEQRVPISYTITSRDVVGSEDYDDTPDMRTISIPLSPMKAVGLTQFVLSTVSPDFSTN